MSPRLSPILLALAVAACSSQPKADPGEAGKPVVVAQKVTEQVAQQGEEKYVAVTRDGAPFYQYGPAQPTGPDHYLPKGEVVRCVRQESGFSQVELEMGQTGYIANRYLADAPAPAPPLIPAEFFIEEAPLPPAGSAADPQGADLAPAFRLGPASAE